MEAITDPRESRDLQFALDVEKAQKTVEAGANWFFWIAGLSLVNALIAAFGGQWSFIIGLGTTQIIDAIAMVVAQEFPTVNSAIVHAIAFLLDAMVALIAVFFGVLARKRHGWAFVVGMVLYTLDGLIFVLVQDWPSVLFHAFALFCIYGGWVGLKRLRSLEIEAQRSGLAPGIPSSVAPAAGTLDTQNPYGAPLNAD